MTKNEQLRTKIKFLQKALDEQSKMLREFLEAIRGLK